VRSHPARGASACLLLAPALTLAAGAPSAGLSLRWSDPNGLGATTAEEFEARLSERLGHKAFDPALADRTLSVSWQGSPDRCRVELSLVRSGEIEGTREIESPNGDCPGLVPALLTVAALLVEAEQPAPPGTATSPPPPPARSPPPTPTAPRPAEPPIRDQAAVLVSVGGALTSGFAPELELAPAAALVWTPSPHLRLGLEGALFLERRYGDDPGFSLNHQRAGLLACGMPLHDQLALGFCANAALQFFTSEGASLPHPKTRHATTISVGGGLRAEWRLASHWWWVGQVGADASTRRLYFYYTRSLGGETTLFRQPRVMPTLLLGLAFELQ
jgi:hypothetical protein